MKRLRVLLALLAVVVLASACGGRGDDDTDTAADGTTQTTAEGGDAACEGVSLEATEVGVTADTITVEVMADVGSPLAPGLFQGNVDAMNAFADHVNDNGGIACRELVVDTWDSKLNAEESKNGLIEACRNALAMVGSNALFNPDVTPMSGCVDKAGQATGLPDIAALANDVNQQCNTTTFLIQAVAEHCPVNPNGPRPLDAFVGNTKYYLDEFGPLHGLFMVPGDLPTTVQSATYQVKATEAAGVTWDHVVKVSGRDPQAAYTPRIQLIKGAGSNFVYNGSNDRAMIAMRKEANAQGVDSVKLWACSLACYTRNMVTQGGADVEGTYVWMQFLPFEEADTNDALKAYVDAVGEDKVDSFGAQAWQAGLAFQEAVETIVEEDGPNGITRAKMLEVLKGMKDFDAGGWMGAKDLRGMSDCMVVLKIEGGEFVRVFPEERGTLACQPENVVTVTLDPAVEAAKIQ